MALEVRENIGGFMNLCSDRHEEICFEGRNCPLCEIRQELEESIGKLNERIAQLNDALSAIE